MGAGEFRQTVRLLEKMFYSPLLVLLGIYHCKKKHVLIFSRRVLSNWRYFRRRCPSERALAFSNGPPPVKLLSFG